MATQKRLISKRKHKTRFVESVLNTPCPRSIQKKIMANLQKAAHSRISPERAQRAREILKQIKAEQTADERRR